VFTEEANTQLSLHVSLSGVGVIAEVWVPRPSLEYFLHETQVTNKSCTTILHQKAITVFCVAAIGFAFLILWA